MIKKVNKIFTICIMLTCFLINSNGLTAYAANNYSDYGKGYRVRWDNPHTGEGRYHAHVIKNGKEIGSERCGGGKSHKDEFYNVDKKIKDKVRADKKYKDRAGKNRKLDKAANEIRRKKLTKAGKIALAITLVTAATGTLFFPADDVAAWTNLIRTIAFA